MVYLILFFAFQRARELAMEELMSLPIGATPITIERYLKLLKRTRKFSLELIKAREELREYRRVYNMPLQRNETQETDPVHPTWPQIHSNVQEALTDLATLRLLFVFFLLKLSHF